MTNSAGNRREPQLDILVPYYRGAAQLQDTINSVLAQRSTAWRLTIVDDAGPDQDAAQVLAACVPEQLKSRVRLVRNVARLGIAVNFTKCFRLARAPYCTLLGADDLLAPNYTDVVLRAFGRCPHATFVQPGVAVINAQGESIYPLVDRVKGWLRPAGHRVLSGESLAASLMHGDWLYFPSLAWRTDAISHISFDPTLHTAMDLDVILHLVAAGAELVLDPTPCFAYRRQARSASSQSAVDGSRFTEELALYRLWAERFDQMGWSRARRAARLRWTSRAHHAQMWLKRCSV